MKIKKIDALQILDSRGNPTVRAYVQLDDDSIHTSSVPSGASTGAHEALELRDGDEAYHGQGVEKAVSNIQGPIAQLLQGKPINDPKQLDQAMIDLDDSNNKANLGANAILGVSMALHRAAAHEENQELWQYLQSFYFGGLGQNPSFPRLMVNVINGGKHAGWAFDIQEFMIVPQSNSPQEAVRMASEIFQQMKIRLKEHHHSTAVGDEGGFAPKLGSNEEAYKLIIDAAKTLGYENEDDFQLAMDAAASEFYRDGHYVLHGLPEQFVKDKDIHSEEKDRRMIYYLTSTHLQDYYHQLKNQYGIYSFEDPFAEDDWHAFHEFTQKVGNDCLIVGDDLLVTNTQRIQTAIEKKAANAVLIKLNQIGSVKETIDAIKMTHEQGWESVISHRSGETEDIFISDLACAAGSGFIKTGSVCRGERTAKYNRLLEIEHFS